MISLARSALGPLCLAGGVWAAAGSLAVSDVGGEARYAIPASGIWLLSGLVVGFLIPGLRRNPPRASVALLGLVPWLPAELPRVAYLFTGHLAWLPVGLAVAAGWMGLGSREDRALEPTPTVSGRRGALRAGALTLAVSVATAWSLASRLPGGDEPHYLVIAQSLLADGDLAIENNHARRDYAAYFAGDLGPHYLRRGMDGQIYSIHAPGVSVLVLPFFLIAGYAGAQAAVMVLAALGGCCVWLAAWWATRSRHAAWFAWAAVVGSATFAFQSVTIFPDGPGAALVAFVGAVLVRWVVQRQVTLPTVVAVSVALAFLPFLHSRFVVIACGLGLVAVFVLWRAAPSEGAWRRVVAFLVVPTVGALAWFGYFLSIYGTPNPSAPYGANPETSAWYVPGGLIALFVDQQFGLLTYAPVLAASFWGLAARGARTGTLARACAGVAAVYLAATATYWMWWGGVPATPARFAAAVLPLASVPMALAWERSSRSGRQFLLVLVLLSLTLTALTVGVGDGALLWNTRSPHAAWLEWMGSVVDLTRVWPSFFWRLTPGDVRSEWPFVLHAFTWAGVMAGTVGLGVFMADRWAGRSPAIVAWILPVALIVMTLAAPGVDRAAFRAPTAAALRVAQHAAEGRPLWALVPGRGWTRQSARHVRIDIARVAGGAPASWAPVAPVPAGRYRVVASPAPLRGRVRLGVGATNVSEVVVGDPSATVVLPAGARELRVETDPGLASSASALALESVDLWATPNGTYARRAVVTSAAVVFFHDESAYLEPDAFWVRTASRAVVSLVPRGADQVTLALKNGPRPNTVLVERGGLQEEVPLAPSEQRRLTLPVDPATGALELALRPATGFQPSAEGLGSDARQLGVYVTVPTVGGQPPGQ